MQAEYSTPDESLFLLAINTTRVRGLTFEKTCSQSYLNERQLKLAFAYGAILSSRDCLDCTGKIESLNRATILRLKLALR